LSCWAPCDYLDMKEIARKSLWVGYGRMGRALALSPASGWLRKAGVVETQYSVLAQASTELGLNSDQIFAGVPEGINRCKPQVVVINTPSEFHYAQAATALRAGAHVLVAKPAVSNLPQFERLLCVAKNNRRKVAVGQQLRFNRHYRAVATLIASGELGRISHLHFLNSKPRPDPLNLGSMPHPAMLEMGCHHFDALFSLLPRAYPHAIMARGYKPTWSRYAANSMIDACIDLSGGVRVLYHAGFDAQAACYELRIEGTKGVLRVRGEHMSASNFIYEIAPRSGNFTEVDLESQVPPGTAWALFMEHLRNWLAGGKEPSFSLRNNLKIFALLQAGIESIDRSRPVNLVGNKKYQRLFET